MKDNEKTFVRVSNQDIYNKLGDIELILVKMNGSVTTHQRWLTALTGAFGASFLFIIGWLFTLT